METCYKHHCCSRLNIAFGSLKIIFPFYLIFRLRLRVCPKVSEASCFRVLCNISYMVYDIRLVQFVVFLSHLIVCIG